MDNVVTLNADTGEVMEGCLVWIPKQHKLGNGWFMSFQDALIALAKDEDITGENYRVFFYLCGNLDFENFIHLEQKKISEELNIRKENVSRSVKKLVDKKIILKGPKVGRSLTYRLNPNFGWKGKVKNLHKHLSIVSENTVSDKD
jgi:hypothetical protein